MSSSSMMSLIPKSSPRPSSPGKDGLAGVSSSTFRAAARKAMAARRSVFQLRARRSASIGLRRPNPMMTLKNGGRSVASRAADQPRGSFPAILASLRSSRSLDSTEQLRPGSTARASSISSVAAAADATDPARCDPSPRWTDTANASARDLIRSDESSSTSSSSRQEIIAASASRRRIAARIGRTHSPKGMTSPRRSATMSAFHSHRSNLAAPRRMPMIGAACSSAPLASSSIASGMSSQEPVTATIFRIMSRSSWSDFVILARYGNACS